MAEKNINDLKSEGTDKSSKFLAGVPGLVRLNTHGILRLAERQRGADFTQIANWKGNSIHPEGVGKTH